MEILENKKEMTRLHRQYNEAVKAEYKCDIANFADWLATDGHEDFETEEMYIEIPSNETLSGHAEILDW